MKFVSPNSTLPALGMDSMMAVEIKQILEQEFDVFIAPQEMQNLTFATLIKMSLSINDNEKKELNKKKPNFKQLFIGLILKDEEFVFPIEFLATEQNTTTEVLLISGIDGCGTMFKNIIPYIKFSTSVLHYYTNDIHYTNTMMETANRFTNVCNRINNFILC